MPPYTTPHATFLGFPASTFASTITAMLIHHILVPKVSRYRDINSEPAGRSSMGYTRDFCFVLWSRYHSSHTHPKSMAAPTKLPSMPTIGHRHLESRSYEKGKLNFTCTVSQQLLAAIKFGVSQNKVIWRLLGGY